LSGIVKIGRFIPIVVPIRIKSPEIVFAIKRTYVAASAFPRENYGDRGAWRRMKPYD
jgi:hypothetical protein